MNVPNALPTIDVAEADRAQAGHKLRGFLEGHMAVGHFAARMNQAHRRFGQLLEGRMPSGRGDPERRSCADHPALKLGDFGQCFFNRVLDSANLGGNLIGG